ncbi:MAG: carboxymuconolactone decarboxylase family protein [Actinobacteria bacterium]|nr:carboxymuconolactone decarboxylase family protein [Actinomycetota bacterium]MCI0679355.1 carboxymuconolactone decarboxylase family protein [Actinomycetota bacterium]
MGSYEEGMRRRRQLLGDDHVDRAVAATTGLDEAFQKWITSNVWGEVWTRDGLDVTTRSLVTIAILAAMGHDELELHLEAAKRLGIDGATVGEVLLHVAVYAGVPAANGAFKTAKAIYEIEAS